jgi:hypothetical protein
VIAGFTTSRRPSPFTSATIGYSKRWKTAVGSTTSLSGPIDAGFIVAIRTPSWRKTSTFPNARHEPAVVVLFADSVAVAVEDLVRPEVARPGIASREASLIEPARSAGRGALADHRIAGSAAVIQLVGLRRSLVRHSCSHRDSPHGARRHSRRVSQVRFDWDLVDPTSGRYEDSILEDVIPAIENTILEGRVRR